MARKYLLVEITPEEIKLIQKVAEEDRQKVLQDKGPNQHVWTVPTYQRGIDLINDHNNKIKEAKFNIPKRGEVQVSYPLWDFSKISAAYKEKIMMAFQRKDWGTIMVIHNDLKLTNEIYCCDRYVNDIKYNIERWPA